MARCHAGISGKDRDPIRLIIVFSGRRDHMVACTNAIREHFCHSVRSLMPGVVLLNADNIGTDAVDQPYRFVPYSKLRAVLLKLPEEVHIVRQQTNTACITGSYSLRRHRFAESDVLVHCSPPQEYGHDRNTGVSGVTHQPIKYKRTV